MAGEYRYFAALKIVINGFHMDKIAKQKLIETLDQLTDAELDQLLGLIDSLARTASGDNGVNEINSDSQIGIA